MSEDWNLELTYSFKKLADRKLKPTCLFLFQIERIDFFIIFDQIDPFYFIKIVSGA